MFIIDFGLSKEWRRTGGGHAPFKMGKHLTGTARYVGLNVHRGYEQSRRDDLESIGHMLLYLVLGKLPWQGLGDPGPKRHRHDMIHEVKAQSSMRDVCRELAPQFLQYMQYCRGLDYTDEPDYDYCAGLFRNALSHLSLRTDYSVYDWRRKGIHVDGNPPVVDDATEYMGERRSGEVHCGARTTSDTGSRSPRQHHAYHSNNGLQHI